MGDRSREKVFSSGINFFHDLESEMKLAHQSLDMEVFIFSDDEFGKHFCHLLRQIASRGVKVRLLVDGVGSALFVPKIADLLKESAVELRVFHPMNLSRLFQRILKLNKRNHRKVWIIDGKLAFVGSANVANEYSYMSAPDQQGWKDYGLKFSDDDGISELQRGFDQAWDSSRRGRIRRRISEELRTRDRDCAVFLNDTFRRRLAHYRFIVQKLDEAQDRIWLGNAYLAPPRALLRAICRAGARGVDVRLMIPHQTDLFFMRWLATAYYFKLLKSGVKIFEFTRSFFHGKIMIVDDWVTVGSTNLNHRSLLHDYEVDVALRSPESKAQICESYLTDLGTCRPVTMKDFEAFGFFKRWASRFAMLFRYWL